MTGLLTLRETALKPALAATLYLHRVEALRPAVETMRSAARQMFAGQGVDVLWALEDRRSLMSEAADDDERRTALILAVIAEALTRRIGRDSALLEGGMADALSVALAQASLSRYGIKASLASIDAQRWLKAHGAELVKGINSYTRESLARMLAKAVARGDSMDVIARQIVMRFADMDYARAYKIALTETSKAWSFAELEGAGVMEDSGFVMLKQWLLGPLHPRFDLCDDNAQAGGIPIGQPFPTGDMATPQHPQCGCSIVTYPDPGVRQPWGTNVLGQIPFLPWPDSSEVNNAA